MMEFAALAVIAVINIIIPGLVLTVIGIFI